FRAPAGGVGGTVVWWGTIPQDQIQDVLTEMQRQYQDSFTLQYIEKDPNKLEADLVEALALGKGPDLITLSSDMLLRQSEKLAPIGYDVISQQTFADTYVVG